MILRKIHRDVAKAREAVDEQVAERLVFLKTLHGRAESLDRFFRIAL
jgi:hypothetical protein